MKPFNICIIRPTGYPHSFVFQETANLLMYSLQELGHKAVVAFNDIDVTKINIIIGIHMVDDNFINQIPPSTIILNTEPLEHVITDWKNQIVKYCQTGLEIWDYNDVNVAYLRNNGVNNIKKLCFGYQRELQTIKTDQTRDVDVLFYGSMNERRHIILSELINRSLNVQTLFGVYGNERDEWISRAKVVLDHNHYDYNIFNVVRVFYLLTNGVAVVSEAKETTEIEPQSKEGVIASPYEKIVDNVMRIVHDEEFLHHQRQKALNSIKKYPQSVFTAALINE